MQHFTQNELNKRNKIIKSQSILGSFLDTAIVNKLVKLFDDKYKGPDKIVNYIKDEFIKK